MKALITGITGFVGSHLAEFLLEQGVEVHGTIRHHHLADELRNVEAVKGRITLHPCNLTRRGEVHKVIAAVRPDVIFHLAAHSFVPLSFAQPEEVLLNNIISELNIFETIRELGLEATTKIQIACSSEEYGMVYPQECPIKETNELRPMSQYAVSKVGQEMLAAQYHRTYGLKTIITRAFNHEGPRRGRDFVTSAFASQIAGLEKTGGPGEVRHGNLDAQRDFTDVRDMVRAYWSAVTCDGIQFGVPYNVCSGKAITMKQVLDFLMAHAKVHVTPVIDESRMRPSDVPLLLGDNSKFREATGWEPKVTVEQMLADILEYWRSRV